MQVIYDVRRYYQISREVSDEIVKAAAAGDKNALAEVYNAAARGLKEEDKVLHAFKVDKECNIERLASF